MREQEVLLRWNILQLLPLLQSFITINCRWQFLMTIVPSGILNQEFTQCINQWTCTSDSTCFDGPPLLNKKPKTLYCSWHFIPPFQFSFLCELKHGMNSCFSFCVSGSGHWLFDCCWLSESDWNWFYFSRFLFPLLPKFRYTQPCSDTKLKKQWIHKLGLTGFAFKMQ